MGKKYRFTGETMEHEGRTLRRIGYIRDIYPFIKKGSLGGWIEHEGNLSHEGTCRVVGVAMVYGSATLKDNAVVGNNAIVKDNAQLFDNVSVGEFCVIGADTIITGKSVIHGKSRIFFYSNGLNDSGNKMEPNISGKSIISNSTIEATGRIDNVKIKSKELSGELNMYS